MKAILNRIKRLEQKEGKSDAFRRYLDAINGLSTGPPSERPPITQEQEERIDRAWSQLCEEDPDTVNQLIDHTHSRSQKRG